MNLTRNAWHYKAYLFLTGEGTKIYWCQYKNLDEYYTTEELFEMYLKSLK